jgi:hypothetical protein
VAAYAFCLGAMANGVYGPYAIFGSVKMVSAFTVTPSTMLAPRLFKDFEIETGKSTWLLGLAGITEGAIPMAIEDPIRVIGSFLDGSVVTGAMIGAAGIGLLSPLMLNVVELEPGEAMFLHAETPHAYVQGTGLEIMANSDNVLRAGLTPKHMDVAELIDNTRFHSIRPEQIKLTPYQMENKIGYPIPVDDFGFEILKVGEQEKSQFVRGAEILFCVEGEMTVSSQETSLTLQAGESLFVCQRAGVYRYQGRGTLARAFN